MSLLYEVEAKPPRLVVFDEKNRRLTDTQAIDDLFGSGKQFEAAAAQAMVVEGLTTQYLVLHAHVRRKKLFDRNGKSAKLIGNLTFGRTVSLLISSDLLHAPDLSGDLEQYVSIRNTIAHELVGSSAEVDFENFMDIGRRVIAGIAPYVVEIVEKANARDSEKRT
jgi:hypothetical protein